MFPFTFTTSVSQESTTYHFNVTVGPGPDAKAEAVDVKCFHSPSQRCHRKVPLWTGTVDGPTQWMVSTHSGRIRMTAGRHVRVGVFEFIV